MGITISLGSDETYPPSGWRLRDGSPFCFCSPLKGAKVSSESRRESRRSANKQRQESQAKLKTSRSKPFQPHQIRRAQKYPANPEGRVGEARTSNVSRTPAKLKAFKFQITPDRFMWGCCVSTTQKHKCLYFIQSHINSLFILNLQPE